MACSPNQTLRRTQQSYHALVVCSHFFGVIGVKHASSFILLVSGVAKATALAAVSWAGAERWPVPLERTGRHSQMRTRLKDPSGKFSSLRKGIALPYMGGTLLVRGLWRGGAGVFWLAASSDLASALLEPSSAPALRRRWVGVVGHTPVFICGIGFKHCNTWRPSPPLTVWRNKYVILRMACSQVV